MNKTRYLFSYNLYLKNNIKGTWAPGENIGRQYQWNVHVPECCTKEDVD